MLAKIFSKASFSSRKHYTTITKKFHRRWTTTSIPQTARSTMFALNVRTCLRKSSFLNSSSNARKTLSRYCLTASGSYCSSSSASWQSATRNVQGNGGSESFSLFQLLSKGLARITLPRRDFTSDTSDEDIRFGQLAPRCSLCSEFPSLN
eukprot:m.99215 g.99215  ORF g.99215 m.99215 type:complete len:150 (+) comp51437_c0_seq9:2102-2551(+)